MTPESDFPIVASSNNDDVNNVKDDTEVWTSNPADENGSNPTLTITVSDEDTYVEEVVVDTDNVITVTVSIVNKEGVTVSLCLL